MPKNFEPDNTTHKGDKQKTLTVTLRSGEVFDMAALTAPANHYKLGSDYFQNIIAWSGVRDEAIFKGKSNFDNKIVVVLNFPSSEEFLLMHRQQASPPTGMLFP